MDLKLVNVRSLFSLLSYAKLLIRLHKESVKDERTNRIGGQNPNFKMTTLESLNGELHRRKI